MSPQQIACANTKGKEKYLAINELILQTDVILCNLSDHVKFG